MKRELFLLVITMVLSVSASGQSLIQSGNNKEIPISIYSFTNPILQTHNLIKKNNNTFYEYQLPKFDFVFLDFRDLEEGRFIIDPENFGKKPSRLIYESYNDFYNLPQRGFMRKYDPTLWWICP